MKTCVFAQLSLCSLAAVMPEASLTKKITELEVRILRRGGGYRRVVPSKSG